MPTAKRKRLGQHSLVDEEVILDLLKGAEVSKDDVVFEFGAGNGYLTEKLCERVGRVVSYEIDDALYLEAKRRLNPFKNLKLIHGDALKSKYAFSKLVSNIPYSRSRDFIEWLSKQDFERAVVTVQKEFAEKLLSPPGSRAYRAISVLAGAKFFIKPLRDVDRSAFSPRPKVMSTILLLRPKHKQKVDHRLIRFLKILISFRGRKVEAAVRRMLKGANPDAVLKKIGSEARQKRVEWLTVEEAMKVAKVLARYLR